MATRKTLPKKTRFEVFKRDSFKCQYCGRSAPDVILEIDHIIPVAEGGKDDIINLVTSCRDCNRGKGKIKLSNKEMVNRQKKQLDEMNELREQTEMMIEWKRELIELESKQVSAINDWLATETGYAANKNGQKKLKELISRFGFSEVYDATILSFRKYKNWEYAFNKIGGICYNKKWNLNNSRR